MLDFIVMQMSRLTMKGHFESMLPHGVTKVSRRSPLNERSSEHDVAGMTAKMDATF